MNGPQASKDAVQLGPGWWGPGPGDTSLREVWGVGR